MEEQLKAATPTWSTDGRRAQDRGTFDASRVDAISELEDVAVVDQKRWLVLVERIKLAQPLHLQTRQNRYANYKRPYPWRREVEADMTKNRM